MQRKRMRAPNYADLSDLETKITAFVAEWNDIAHPFKWSPKSPIARASAGSVI